MTASQKIAARLEALRKFAARRGVLIAIPAVFAPALLSNLYAIPLTKPLIDQKLTEKGDFRSLYFAAANASWGDVPKWFAGPWNSPGIGYYRPLTSVLFLAEQRAFGRDFARWNAVSWLVNGLNAVLLFLLAVLLLKRYPIGRIVFGLIAVRYFATPAASLISRNAVYDIIWWFPAQNDSFGLMFGLLSLALLIRYAEKPQQRAWLVGSYASFAASVGFKEQGYVTAPVAIALLIYLDRRLWRAMAGFGALAAGMWFFRLLVVPHPWGQGFASPDLFGRLIFRASGPVYLDVTGGLRWATTATLAVLGLVAIGIRRRWSFYSILGAMLAAEVICAAVVAGLDGWAIPLEPDSQLKLLHMAIYLGSLALFWTYRRTEAGLPVAFAYLCALLPSLQYAGRHYFYWSAAFLGLADGTFAACLWRWVVETVPGVNSGRFSAAGPSPHEVESGVAEEVAN